MSAFAGANPLTVENKSALPVAEGFAEFVGRNAQLAYRVAYARLRHPGDAEDAVQEVFLKLMKKDRWLAARDERAFIARAVWRVAADIRTRYPQTPEGSERPEQASREPDPEQQAVQMAEHARVHMLVDALPEKLRHPLVLSAFEDLTSTEVAAVLGLPEGTVRRRVAEARALLRDKLLTLEVRRAR